MKIEINYGIKPNEIDEDFVGLCVDNDNYIWLAASCGAVCIGRNDDLNDVNPPLVYDRLEWKSALENQGPFTKFNGSVTLEND